MTGEQLTREDFAAKLREQRRATQKLVLELVHRGWGGDPSHDQILAALYRANAHMEAAAGRLAGAEPPSLRAHSPEFVGTLTSVAAVTVTLLAMSVPARPAVVTGVVVGGIFVGGVLSVATRAILRRRALSTQPPPLLATSGTFDEAVTDALREAVASLDVLLSEADPPSDDKRGYALEQTHAARGWVALVLESREGLPRGVVQQVAKTDRNTGEAP